jgi:hypothetical protein
VTFLISVGVMSAVYILAHRRFSLDGVPYHADPFNTGKDAHDNERDFLKRERQLYRHLL